MKYGELKKVVDQILRKELRGQYVVTVLGQRIYLRDLRKCQGILRKYRGNRMAAVCGGKYRKG